MYVNLSKQIYENLVKQDFMPFASKPDDIITKDTISLSLIKLNNNIVYIISILNTFTYDPQVCMGKVQIERTNFIKNNPQLNIKTLSIFLCEDNTQCVDYISKIDKNILCELNDIYWAVDFNNNQPRLFNNKLQPSKVIGIEKIIHSLKQDIPKTETDNSVTSVTAKAIYTSPLRIKRTTFDFYMIIIIINVILFLNTYFNGGLSAENLLDYGAYSYNRIINYNEYSRLLTAMFLHGSLSHIMSNMFTLYIFGRSIEKSTSHTNFLATYFFSGIGANVLMLLTPTTNVMVGASGAIFGLIGSAMVLTFYFKKSIFGLSHSAIFALAIINLSISVVVPEISFLVHLYGFIIGCILGYVYAIDEKRKLQNKNN